MSPDRAGTDRVDRTHGRIAAGDIDEPVAGHRRADRDLRVRPERPQLLARGRVVAANLGAVGDEHVAAVRGACDRRRAPRGDLVCARRLPERLASGHVPCRDVRALLHVGLQDHRVAIDDRRARMAPLERRIEEPSAVERAKGHAPQFRAVVVPRDHHAGRSEHRHDTPAIGHRRRTGLAALGVAFRSGCATDGAPLPQDLSGRLIDAVDLPFVRRQIVDGLDVAVESGLEAVVAGFADRRGGEDPVAPHDRTRHRDAGNRRLPFDILAARHIPFGDRALSVAVAAAAIASERWPVARTRSAGTP